MGFHQRFMVHDLKKDGWEITSFKDIPGGVDVIMYKGSEKCRIDRNGVKHDL